MNEKMNEKINTGPYAKLRKLMNKKYSKRVNTSSKKRLPDTKTPELSRDFRRPFVAEGVE